jgi:hypothetical protein
MRPEVGFGPPSGSLDSLTLQCRLHKVEEYQTNVWLLNVREMQARRGPPRRGEGLMQGAEFPGKSRPIHAPGSLSTHQARSLVTYEWHLLVGAEVEVIQRGRIVRSGIVDDATADGTVAWVAQDGVEQRRLIDKADGYELWTGPTQIHAFPQPIHSDAPGRA